jgi:hypothetical protein
VPRYADEAFAVEGFEGLEEREGVGSEGFGLRQEERRRRWMRAEVCRSAGVGGGGAVLNASADCLRNPMSHVRSYIDST